MCWAALDRLGRIAHKVGESADSQDWFAAASELKERVLEGAWNGVPARQALPPYVDDETVLQAVRRVVADGIAHAGPESEDLLNQAPRLTPRGRRLLEQLSEM